MSEEFKRLEELDTAQAKEGIEWAITYLIQRSHGTALAKGWHPSQDLPTFGEQIALMHSELSEAIEDHRNGHAPHEIYFEEKPDGSKKPCGIPVEFADVLIRLFDTCGKYGIDLAKALILKMEYNDTRPFRHGGKKL